MATVESQGVCCVDCALWIACDEQPDMPADDLRAWQEGAAAGMAGYNAVYVGDLDADFSRQPCDVCGSHLAGERHQVVFLTDYYEHQ